MTAKTDCLATLLRLIEQADRNELAEAQAAIIQYALAASSLASRSEAMADLQTDLAAATQATELQPVQAAYYAVVDAMIDRTRDAVLAKGPPAEPQ